MGTYRAIVKYTCNFAGRELLGVDTFAGSELLDAGPSSDIICSQQTYYTASPRQRSRNDETNSRYRQQNSRKRNFWSLGQNPAFLRVTGGARRINSREQTKFPLFFPQSRELEKPGGVERTLFAKPYCAKKGREYRPDLGKIWIKRVSPATEWSRETRRPAAFCRQVEKCLEWWGLGGGASRIQTRNMVSHNRRKYKKNFQNFGLGEKWLNFSRIPYRESEKTQLPTRLVREFSE